MIKQKLTVTITKMISITSITLLKGYKMLTLKNTKPNNRPM